MSQAAIYEVSVLWFKAEAGQGIHWSILIKQVGERTGVKHDALYQFVPGRGWMWMYSAMEEYNGAVIPAVWRKSNRGIYHQLGRIPEDYARNAAANSPPKLSKLGLWCLSGGG